MVPVQQLSSCPFYVYKAPGLKYETWIADSKVTVTVDVLKAFADLQLDELHGIVTFYYVA